jgi:hypothetical protein
MEKTFHDLDPRGDVVLVLETWGDPGPGDEAPATEEITALDEAGFEAEEIPAQSHRFSPQEIRAQVSSSHLRLASPYFDRMFVQTGWKVMPLVPKAASKSVFIITKILPLIDPAKHHS